MGNSQRKAIETPPANPRYVIGDNVPWNTLWSAEQAISVKRCEYARGALATWQPSAQGEGKPVFKTQHHVRQRMCIRLFLCSVCGKHTPPEDRLFFPFRLAGDDRQPAKAWLMTESPVHRTCAEHSQQACPFLKQNELRPLIFPGEPDYEIEPVWDVQRRGVVKFLAYKFSWNFVRSVVAPALKPPQRP